MKILDSHIAIQKQGVWFVWEAYNTEDNIGKYYARNTKCFKTRRKAFKYAKKLLRGIQK